MIIALMILWCQFGVCQFKKIKSNCHACFTTCVHTIAVAMTPPLRNFTVRRRKKFVLQQRTCLSQFCKFPWEQYFSGFIYKPVMPISLLLFLQSFHSSVSLSTSTFFPPLNHRRLRRKPLSTHSYLFDLWRVHFTLSLVLLLFHSLASWLISPYACQGSIWLAIQIMQSAYIYALPFLIDMPLI